MRVNGKLVLGKHYAAFKKGSNLALITPQSQNLSDLALVTPSIWLVPRPHILAYDGGRV